MTTNPWKLNQIKIDKGTFKEEIHCIGTWVPTPTYRHLIARMVYKRQLHLLSIQLDTDTLLSIFGIWKKIKSENELIFLSKYKNKNSYHLKHTPDQRRTICEFKYLLFAFVPSPNIWVCLFKIFNIKKSKSSLRLQNIILMFYGLV